MKRLAAIFCGVGVLLVLAGRSFGVEFLPEERVTFDLRNYEMTRNPNHSMAVGRDGTLHLVFWSGDGSLQTSPDHPTTVWYYRRAPTGRWAAPEAVDDSYTSMGRRVGGRHPSLVLRSNGEVRVFWHDYRHCTAARNWIDNIELYADARPSSGSFSANDLRLTNTTAIHNGDNGYVPQAVAAPNGELFLAWYDYHFDRNLADVFLMRSDGQGLFDLAMPLDAWRTTSAALRGNTVSYTLPDVAVDSSSTAHLVWTRDNQSGFGVFYSRKRTAAAPTVPVLLSASGGEFLDPPHISLSPRGDVYAAWTTGSVVVARLRPGGSAFDPPMTLAGSPSRKKHADLKVDPLGLVHVVWIDDRNGHDEVFYGMFDPERKILLSEQKVSEGFSDSARPAIALGTNRAVYVAWTDYRTGRGQIFFRTTARPAQAKPQWKLYR